MSVDTSYFSSWIEIDTQAIRDNLVTLSDSATAKNMQSLLMVKANAYGHGMEQVARIANASHIHMLGVSFLTEALALRKAGISLALLIVNHAPTRHLQDLADNAIATTVYSVSYLKTLDNWTRTHEQPLTVHIKINTGLNRFGFRENELRDIIEILRTNKLLVVAGIYTHYSMADSNEALTQSQYEHFLEAVRVFTETGITIPLIHASNSAGLGWANNNHTNLVRLGLAAYGLQPASAKDYPDRLKPSLTWKARVLAVNTINAGDFVGYGKVWAAPRQSVIAVIGVGYSDGIRRDSKGRCVLIAGQKAPIIGNVMMNHAMIDITDIKGEIIEGSIVTLIGTDNGAVMSLEEIASSQGTINEEIVTMISPMIPRIYI